MIKKKKNQSCTLLKSDGLSTLKFIGPKSCALNIPYPVVSVLPSLRITSPVVSGLIVRAPKSSGLFSPHSNGPECTKSGGPRGPSLSRLPDSAMAF